MKYGVVLILLLTVIFLSACEDIRKDNSNDNVFSSENSEASVSEINDSNFYIINSINKEEIIVESIDSQGKYKPFQIIDDEQCQQIFDIISDIELNGNLINDNTMLSGGRYILSAYDRNHVLLFSSELCVTEENGYRLIISDKSIRKTYEISKEQYESLNNLLISPDFDIYSEFTPLEIEQMVYSQKAIFSLTTNYDSSVQNPVKIGDNVTVQLKLTNMTDKIIDTTMLPPPEIITTSEKNINPYATGNEENYTFRPYETVIYNITITISDDLIVSDDSYHFGASTVIDVSGPEELCVSNMLYPFYIISLDDYAIPCNNAN